MTSQDFRSPGGRVSKSVTWCFTPSQPLRLCIRTKGRKEGGREGEGNVIQVCTALLQTCFVIISSADVFLLLLVFFLRVLNTAHIAQPPTSSLFPETVLCSVPYLWMALRWSISHQFGVHLKALESITACAVLPSSDALISPG